MKLSHIPLRLATGAFILNSGLGKRDADEQTAAGMQGMAAGAYPTLGGVQPQTFAKALSAAEMGLGAALILPFVPSSVAGAALTAFGSGLIGMYLKTEGMTQPGSVRPTQQGTPIAKDIWLVGAGLTLLLDSMGRKARDVMP